MKKGNSASRLSELIKTLNIKQSDIVDKTGIPKSAISMYVSGQRVPRQDRISDIANAYNVNEAWLMGYDVPMKRDSSAPLDSSLILSAKDERDIEKRLVSALEQLENGDGLMFNGEVLDENTKELLALSLRNTIESAKIAAKKFTPNKYKK